MEEKYGVWKSESLSKAFLENVRGAIPFAAEQADIMMRFIRTAVPKVKTLLDLGCGDGILGRTILSGYPAATGVFLDFSEAMIAAARKKCGSRCEFITADFGNKGWTEFVREKRPFDLVVSGFAIHHQPDPRKKELYREVFDLLRPGGVFLNLEHVSSKSKWLENMFEEQFVDSLYDYHKRSGSKRSREQVAREFYNRPDKEANILAPVELQCQWLDEIGYEDVDCYFKAFELALFGGRKPV
jgi:tRNA (cmo5U34)-methyltransferase